MAVFSTQIGIFAKHWTPGRVKTRLAASVGETAAAEVAKAFVETLTTRLAGRADRCVVGFAPSDQQAAFADLAGDGWALAPQCDGDLGRRMGHYFQSAFDAGAERVVLLGADSPDVPLAHVQLALDSLETQRLVLGPTDDGGYYLIGARGEPPPVLDNMPFSSERLWQATLERLASLNWREGCEWIPLPAWYDVDTIEDLRRLAADIVGRQDDPALARLGDTVTPLVMKAADAGAGTPR